MCIRDRNAPCPVYVIGSEVPVPGGVKGEDEGLRVTSPEAFERTLRLFCEEFGKDVYKRQHYNMSLFQSQQLSKYFRKILIWIFVHIVHPPQ